MVILQFESFNLDYPLWRITTVNKKIEKQSRVIPQQLGPGKVKRILKNSGEGLFESHKSGKHRSGKIVVIASMVEEIFGVLCGRFKYIK